MGQLVVLAAVLKLPTIHVTPISANYRIAAVRAHRYRVIFRTMTHLCSLFLLRAYYQSSPYPRIVRLDLTGGFFGGTLVYNYTMT